MRIAVWHNFPSGGGKRALYDHVRGLVERGHTVESWCTTVADQTYLPLSELIVEHVVPFEWRQTPAGRGRFYEVFNLYGDVAGNLKEMDRHCRQCAEEINRGNFDVLFANSCMFQSVAPIGRHVDLPKVLYLQEPFRPIYEPSLQETYRQLAGREPVLPWIAPPKVKSFAGLKTIKRFPRDFMYLQGMRIQAREEWLNAKVYDTILVNSFFSRESVIRTYGFDATVCYLGVDTRKFVNRHLPREDFVIGLGAFTPNKSIHFVVESIARIPAPRPRLVWVGNNPEAGYLRELIELAAALNVQFEPRVRIEDEELVDLLNRAAVMVYAPRLEPFGYAPLEANACGLPVIGVAEGGLRETIIDGVNGLLIERRPEAVAAAIERLARDTTYARELGEAGCRLAAERWSLRSAVDRLERQLAERAAA